MSVFPEGVIAGVGGGATVAGVEGTGVIAIVVGAVMLGSTSDGDTSSGDSPEEHAAAIKATSIPPQTALASRDARRETRQRDRRVSF